MELNHKEYVKLKREIFQLRRQLKLVTKQRDDYRHAAMVGEKALERIAVRVHDATERARVKVDTK